MCHPLIDFVGVSIAIDLLFGKYYGIDDDSNGDKDDDNSGEGTTLIGARVLDRRTCRGEAGRTSLHGGNCLVSTSLLKGLVIGLSVVEAVAARAGDGPTSSVVNRARHAIKRQLATTILATAGPLSSSSSLLSPSLSSSSLLSLLLSLLSSLSTLSSASL